MSSSVITNVCMIATPFMPQVKGYKQKEKAKTERLWFKKHLTLKMYQIPHESIKLQVLLV